MAPRSLAVHRHGWFLLLAVALLAWWPLLLARPEVADDHLNGALVAHGLGKYWATYGIWRSAGHPVPFWMGAHLPGGDRLTALGVHLLAVTLFYALLRRVVASPALHLAAALCFAAMPFGFEALTWNSALSFALSTLFLLGAALCALVPAPTLGRAAAAGAGAAVLGFLSLSANEATLLLVAWLAGFHVLLGLVRKEERRRWLTAALILAGEAAWIALYSATKSTMNPKAPAFHAPALISGLFRQTIQASYFIHLPHLGPWLPVAAWLSALLALAAVWPLLRAAPPAEQRTWRAPETLAFILLPIAAVAIYALSNGFSTDARKAYVLWPFLLLATAYLLSTAPPRAQRFALTVSVLLCPFFVLSSQATVRAWSQTGTLFEKAAIFLQEEKPPGPYRFTWDPEIYAAWPDFDRLCGFRFDTPWVVAAGTTPEAELPGPSRTHLRWRAEAHTWEIVP